MGGWLFNDYAYLYSVPAILGTAYFLISLVLGELGGDADADIGIEGGDTPVAEFRVLSLQTISAFAMGSGWAGITAYRVIDMSFVGATVIAILAGLGAAWLIASLLRAMIGLQSSGNIALGTTLGQTGTVYVSVPPKGSGSGRVTVVVNRRRREFDAVQDGDEAIATNTRVGIVGVDRPSNTVRVEVI